jgi:hypothetical protein
MNRELLLISIYCMVDDYCTQPTVAGQLIRAGRRPKLPDVALLTPAIFQEFSGLHKEDDYWAYVRRNFATEFPGQLVDRSQYHRRKKNLSALIGQLRHYLIGYLTGPDNLHIIDCIGTTAMTVTKFFRTRSFP